MRQPSDVAAWSRSALPTTRVPSGAHAEMPVGSLWRDIWLTRIVARSITKILCPPSREER